MLLAIILIFVGTFVLASLLFTYSAEKPTPPAATIEKIEQPANVGVQLSAGALRGKVIDLPLPVYPEDSKTEGVSGAVNVEVRVNKGGTVTSARALSGPQSLRAVAVEAAKNAKFSSKKLGNQRSSTSGVITYHFKL